MPDRPDLVAALTERDFALVPAEAMRRELGELPGWDAFAASWGDLAVDPYVTGRYRRRRHARFLVDASGSRRLPHGPHFQSVDYNPLFGGIERWFEPITDEIGGSPAIARILAWAHGLFGGLAPDVRAWDVELHQFRIEARPGAAGHPTPEGPHRDGVDYVLVLLVQRVNIASGTTTIHAPDGSELGSFTLARPFDAALVHDPRVYHGVTPVEPVDPTREAYRDVLVVTFRRAVA